LDIASLNFTVNYHENVTKPEFYLFPAGSLLPVGSDGNLDFVTPVGMSLFTDGVIGAPSSFAHYLNLKLTQVIDYKTHKIRWQVGYQEDSLRTREAKNFGPGVLDGSEAVVDGQLTDVTGTDHIYLADVGSRFYFLSIMDQWEVNERWLVNIGARYDHYSNFGSTTNPRLGLIYRFTPQLKTKLFAGSAFRAPSFNELYIRNNPVTRGNPELEPETVDTLETGLGFEYTLGDNLFFAVDVFRYHAKDLIAFEFNPQLQLNQAVNTGELAGHGLEFNIRYKPIADITLQINGSLLEAEDEDNIPLAGYPGKMLYGGIAWRLNESVSWSIDSRWVSDRAREAGDSRPEIEDYIWFNSSLTIQDLLPQLEATFTVKNLFDSDASEPATAAIADDFPLHGRFWQLQLRYHF
jgi:iron complex outermembrane receptor protein